MNDAVISLKNIQHRFFESDWELQIPHFNLFPRQILGIIGPNGSGKSTLIRIAAGILQPLRGSVLLQNKDMKKLKRRTIARNLGYLPQELISQYDYSVEELVSMGRYPHTRGIGSLDQSDLEAVRRSHQLTDMEALSSRPLSRLSGGEKKRAFLASVLSQEPKALLLDEPTSALDIHYQVRFFRLLKKLAKEGMGIAVVTHDINFASFFSNNLMLLKGGKSLASGSSNEVLTYKNVEEAYGKEILMGRHPETDCPTVLPRVIQDKEK